MDIDEIDIEKISVKNNKIYYKNTKFDEILVKCDQITSDRKPCKNDHTLYIKISNKKYIDVLNYISQLINSGNSDARVITYIESLAKFQYLRKKFGIKTMTQLLNILIDKTNEFILHIRIYLTLENRFYPYLVNNVCDIDLISSTTKSAKIL